METLDLMFSMAAGFLAAAIGAGAWFRYANKHTRHRERGSWGRHDDEIRRLRDL